MTSFVPKLSVGLPNSIPYFCNLCDFVAVVTLFGVKTASCLASLDPVEGSTAKKKPSSHL